MTMACGSAPIRAEVLPALEAVLGKPVINRYGMTEAFVITSLPLDGPWPYGSVGQALPGVESIAISNKPLFPFSSLPGFLKISCSISPIFASIGAEAVIYGASHVVD